jgi:putative Mg2+ transporter-C (MgtC) family protein
LRGHSAGFRTHILVAVSACLFTMAGAFGFSVGDSANAAIRADVTRVASQVVVGIGFLGAGVIVRHGRSVRGLTTAANLWCAAAVGLAMAVGFYLGAVLTASIALLVLGLKPLERWLATKRPNGHSEPPDA